MDLYWWLVGASLKDVLIILSLILGMTSGFLLIPVAIAFSNDEDYKKKLAVGVACLFSFVFFCLIASCFLPSRKDLAIMYGWDAIRSDTVKEVVENLTKRVA